MCGRRTPEAAPISDPSSASAESTNDEEVVSGEGLDLKILFGLQFCSALLHTLKYFDQLEKSYAERTRLRRTRRRMPRAPVELQ